MEVVARRVANLETLDASALRLMPLSKLPRQAFALWTGGHYNLGWGVPMRATRGFMGLGVLVLSSACASSAATVDEGGLDTEREIFRLQEAWVQAAVDADADAFAQFMDDAYKAISGGRVRDKATWVEAIRSGRATYEAVQYHNVDVNLYADTVAVISGEYSQKATAAGQDNSKPGVFVATWVKRDGRWRAVASIYP